MPEIACPVCNADISLDGDEHDGDTVFCSYCTSPLRIVVKASDGSVSVVDDT
ncbi:MAG: hypothetical protein JSV26_12260 [bacterium]|nr:MAG: hypothetical protein JSV26_12260 [bacterium]